MLVGSMTVLLVLLVRILALLRRLVPWLEPFTPHDWLARVLRVMEVRASQGTQQEA
jgi:ABC-type transport system involved in cytochrome bd biosynthesis fused ATPase/permease subunit